MISAEVDAALDGADALLMPTLPQLPPMLDDIGKGASVLSLSSLVRSFNLSGQPALSIPVRLGGHAVPASLQGFSEPLAKAIAFIWNEAELLDKKDYAAWSSLRSEDGYDVMPIDHDATDFAAQLNYAYDNARMRAMRIERLSSGLSVSADDAATTVRTVSRFVPVHVTEDLVEVNSAQIVVGYQRQAHTLFVTNLSHRICFASGIPKLEEKVVRLVNSGDALNAPDFLL